MSRIDSMITDIRIVIGDQSKQRWPDSDILHLINVGISNFNVHTSFLKRKMYIAIESNVAIYDLRQYAVCINRVQYNYKALQAMSTAQLDKLSVNWTDHVAEEPTAVIFDHLQQGILQIYPKVMEGTINVFEQNSPYGVVIDIIPTDGLFMLPSVENIENEVDKFLVVDFVKKPSVVTLTTSDDDMELTPSYDEAIVNFASGKLLRSDRDATNRAFGNEQLALYEGFLKTAIKKESVNNNYVLHKQVGYRGFI
ncbi:MAG: hypothetical protein AB7D38_11965 [Sulfurimonas sp.]|uniref:hypothetical protein n=1 Tax=Sulfurimonas sp. TaxID=2022749 RepID=UPI003D1253F6